MGSSQSSMFLISSLLFPIASIPGGKKGGLKSLGEGFGFID